MPDFGLELTNDRAAVLRFEQLPRFAHDKLLATLQDLEQRLEAAIIAQEPSRTGALRAMTGGRVYDHGTRMAAVVGVRAPDANSAQKAAALEFGSHKSLEVRVHSAKLAHFWGRVVSPITVEVPAHSRLSNIDARQFLRGPLDAMRAEAVAEMRLAAMAAVDEASA